MRNPTTRRSATATSTSTRTPCCSKLGLKRGPWTPEEDALLANYINKEGEGKWRTLPKRAGLLRCGKSCRLRWMNYLRPCVKRGQIAPDEEDLILRLHRLLGNRWSLIAGRIPGRTDNEIKNYWNTHLSKKLISQGIDPRTHKPLSHGSVDDQRRASSSKPVNVARKTSSPKRKNNDHDNNLLHASSSAAEETASETTQMVVSNEENLCFGSTSFDQYNDNNFPSLGFAGLLSCEEDSGMDMGNNIHGISSKETDLNDCYDFGPEDTFSSFLNSLINEEDFTSQQQQQQQQQEMNGIIPNTGPLVSVNSSTFGYAPGWESSALMSSFNQNDPCQKG